MEYEWFLNRYILPINENLIGTTRSDLSELEIYTNEEVLHTPQNSRNGDSPSDLV